jgi:hypothetical protein
MYTSPLAIEQLMIWESSLFGLSWQVFLGSCIIHLKTGGHMLTTKIVYFVKLSKCETDFTTAFLSLRWWKNICGTPNSESGWRSKLSFGFVRKSELLILYQNFWVSHRSSSFARTSEFLTPYQNFWFPQSESGRVQTRSQLFRTRKTCRLSLEDVSY